MRKNVIFIVVILLAVVIANIFYTLDMTEQAVITYFGEPVAVVTDPGLHMKGPFLWTVNRIERRTLDWDGTPDRITTKDKTFIWVDAFARWRIDDPLQFFKAVRFERSAQSRLDDVIEGATRDQVAQFDLIEVVRNTNRDLVVDELAPSPTVADIKLGREQLATRILERAREIMPDIGVELIDVGAVDQAEDLGEYRQELVERVGAVVVLAVVGCQHSGAGDEQDDGQGEADEDQTATAHIDSPIGRLSIELLVRE